jgi:phage-related minor tail protein
LAIEKRRAQLGTDMPDDQLMQDAELQKVIKGIKDKQQAVVDATQVEITASRDWSTAWGQAFAQYKEDAFNGAMEAKKVFDIATRGMEDAIVSFVKTGKFNFKDLMNTIVEELLRSQIRQLIANIFGGSTMSGAGGLLSGVGKIFGFAQGGVVGGAGPILVGESGPELFIPPTSGSIVPNNSMGNFAGSGSVTYNISAVDARSFQQLVASDPQFLYAVTEQGRLSLPSTRR